MRFHKLLLEFSGNRRLLLIHDMIRFQNERAQMLNILLPKQADSVSEHEELVAALEKKDLDAAIKATAEHSRNTIKRFREILASPFFRRAVLEVRNLYNNSHI